MRDPVTFDTQVRYDVSFEDQVAEYERLAHALKQPVAPLFLVFKTGAQVPAGRVLEASGRVLRGPGFEYVELWLPLSEVVGEIPPDCLLSESKTHAAAGVPTSDCAPVNDAAKRLCDRLNADKERAKS